MSDEDAAIDAERLHYFDKQRVVVDDVEAEGFILDLGGGGEGVIGRLKGPQVVAIDPDRGELAEAADGPLKVVMDATELKFLEASFEVVTAFFTLMYIEPAAHERVFEEAYRALARGGRFLIWGAELPPRPDGPEDVAVLPLSVALPSDELETGYGALWPSEPLGLARYAALGERVGFRAVEQRQQGRTFYLALRKS
jgi:SAM-dependent methyltransferase